LKRAVIAALVFAGALALYLATLCPDLYWFDSAEFVNDAVLLDIPHPPGYPLYNLLAHLATRVPLGTVAARVNALSAVASASALATLFLALTEFGVPAGLAVASCALFGVSDQFWDLSVTAEVYGLEIFFIAVALWCLARLEKRAEPLTARAAFPLGLACGLALFHRPTALFFVAGWTALVWKRLQRPWLFLASMLPGSLAYLYTFWVFFTRVSVAPGMPWSINYFDFPRTLETLLRICTGTLYASNVGMLGPAELAREVHGWVWLSAQQLSPITVGLAALGLARLAKEGRPLARYALVLLVANVGFFLFYNALEKDTMYVPSFLALLLLALSAIQEVWASWWVAPSVAALALGMGLWRLPDNDRHRYHEVRRSVDATARLLPPRAWLYLTDDLIIHPFLHVVIVEGKRRDVQVQEVDGFGGAVKQGVLDRLARKESVFSTLFYPEATFHEVERTCTLVPRGFLYELFTGPAPALPHMKVTGLTGAGVFPPERTLRRSDQLQVVVTWDLAHSEDPAVVFSWQSLTWAFRIGYQHRPREGNLMTEEYLLKVPWDLDAKAGGTAPLRGAVVPSIARALASGSLKAGNTRDWRENVFFKSDAAGFVKCIERGWPVFAEVLTVTGESPAGQELGGVELR